MIRNLFILLALFIIIQIISAQPPSDCPPGYIWYNNGCWQSNGNGGGNFNCGNSSCDYPVNENQ